MTSLDQLQPRGGGFHLAETPPGATSYYTPSDAGDALFAYLQHLGRFATSDAFTLSLWPNTPAAGRSAPGWIIEVRRMGVHAGWICDGRPSGPYTFPPGRQERLSGTNDWENLTRPKP